MAARTAVTRSLSIDRPPVSVVMPVHNAGRYLELAVTSMLAQSHRNIELIVIDDHSTDSALSSLPNDARIRLLSNATRGLVAALNTGLSATQHQLIARMDADDIAHPKRLERQLNYLQQNPDIDICGCRVSMFADSQIGAGYKYYENWINNLTEHSDIEREFFIESPIAHPSALFHRDVIDQIGGYRDGDWPEDYELWCRALLAGLRFGKPTGDPLLHWRDHPERTSRIDQRYRRQGFINCKAHALSAYLRKEGFDKAVIWGTGPTGLKLHDALEKSAFPITGFVDVNHRLVGAKKRDKSIHVVASQQDKAAFTPNRMLTAGQILLSAVSARGARSEIRRFLQARGWSERKHFICAA